jgi:hypothetical protein
VPLELIGAEYTIVGAISRLTLMFDRAISLDGVNGSQISVEDGQHRNRKYLCTGVHSIVNDAWAVFDLVDNGAFAPDDLDVSATETNGIVALDDGGAWEGVLNLPLPYP